MVMGNFETVYRNWMEMHLSKRKGERLRMLKERHGHGEKLFVETVWYPVVGNLDFLHPEYEVVDEDGNYYYIDHAYVRYPYPTAIEKDGFGTHARDADRYNFKRGLRRQNSIVLDDWNILRFSFDDVRDDPEYCRRTLRRMLERWYGDQEDEVERLPLYQREILRVVSKSATPVQPHEIAKALDVGIKMAYRLLHGLVEAGWLETASGTERVHTYRLKKKSGRSGR